MLFNARHDFVTKRLSNPEESFVPFIVQELAQTVFYGLDRDEKPVATPTSAIDPDLDKIMETYHAIELDVDKTMSLSQPEREIGVIDTLETGKQLPHLDMMRLAIYAIIGARNMPDNSRKATVLKQRRPEQPEDASFLRAIGALKAHALHAGEVAAMQSSLAKFEERLNNPDKAKKTIELLNRFYRGRFVENVLKRLFDMTANRRDLIDDIVIAGGDVRDPFTLTYIDNQRAPIIRLPFPILPEGGGEPRPKIEPQEIADEDSEVSAERTRQRHAYRKEWIDALASNWPTGGITTGIDLYTQNSKYSAALLKDKNGEIFAVVADTDYPRNAMYVGIISELRDPGTGENVTWERAFSGFKTDARNLGVRRVEHSGQDFYARVMKLLRTAQQSD